MEVSAPRGRAPPIAPPVTSRRHVPPHTRALEFPRSPYSGTSRSTLSNTYRYNGPSPNCLRENRRDIVAEGSQDSARISASADRIEDHVCSCDESFEPSAVALCSLAFDQLGAMTSGRPPEKVRRRRKRSRAFGSPTAPGNQAWNASQAFPLESMNTEGPPGPERFVCEA